METEFEEFNNENKKWVVRSVLVPEWLSGMTRNHVGSARAGSNPAEHARVWSLSFYLFHSMSSPRVGTTLSSKSESIHNTYLFAKNQFAVSKEQINHVLVS